MLPNAKDTVILVGYQAIGTRGRSLSDGAEEVKMHGEYVPVRARIAKVQEFSVHADANELLKWIGVGKDRVDRIFVVHGEAGAAEALVDRFGREMNAAAVAPKDAQRFDL
jgi:metallo-beta-lactamase family protein